MTTDRDIKPVNPNDYPCSVCSAKPGEQCCSIMTRKPRIAHRARVELARKG